MNAHHHYPKSYPRAKEVSVTVNGRLVDVLRTNVAYFAPVTYSGSAVVEIEAAAPIRSVAISPLKLNIPVEVSGNTARFTLEDNRYLHLKIEGISLPLFFYGNEEQAYDGKATLYFKGGQVYEIGELVLQDNESIYIEDGAIVKGSVRASGASNIKIYGNGVLDGSYFHGTRDYRTILLYDCSNVEIRDIIMVEPPCWMIMLANCRHVHIDRIKQIGEVVSSDGIDIVGCQHVLIENCILRNNDDCVVIKAFDWSENPDSPMLYAAKDVHGIEVRSCVFVNGPSGNAVEIGHELTIDEVRDVKFHDIDIVSVNGYGAALSIHVGDRATVRDIVFENIRIEHYYDKLIDFRVMRSMYNTDNERGRIQDILLKDIEVVSSLYNPGYSISVIGGYDAEHPVERVTFDNFKLGGRKIMDGNELDLFVKEARDIKFK
ncbi:glycosyl hydrolase family 28 protein [Paenibacillus glycanilyticus]|uniref:Endopolygalacturonase n=1 Tax=Paenibacillus glycanilyticus TaxID=126569 RepID=A0ABQ6GQ96_9BACL|nr:glycosyl hydrolase family 28 protein [Paenibacillus glycanilyticus]GLX71516.1 endopolygalacturonase [Paenibacillus glycanilyticus]